MADQDTGVPLTVVQPPSAAVIRVVKREYEPFAPPPWEAAADDGTFGSRFDDPSKLLGLSETERFRIVYCATRRAAALGETMAGFLPPLRYLAKELQADDPEVIHARAASLVDPKHPRHGLVPESWRVGRHLGRTVVDPASRFVDIAAGASVNHLRSALAAEAVRLGLPDFDLSSVTGPQRRLTQACARYVYDQTDEAGQPIYAGIRYVSRLNPAWECWAIFHDRLRHTPAFAETIFPDDPGLLEAAALLGLTIEGFAGQVLRLWR